MDLISIKSLIPDAILDLRYTTDQNIASRVIQNSNDALLNRIVAEALSMVAAELRLSAIYIVVWDAYRTAREQEILRNACNDDRYVRQKSNHCLGVAVDITLANPAGEYLDMGTGFDDFSEKAHVEARDLTQSQYMNRKILRDVMKKYGFKQWQYEWWHFDYSS